MRSRDEGERMNWGDTSDDVKKKFPDYLVETYGIVGAACQKAGIHRGTYYKWRKADPEFAKICDEVEIVTHSFVEDKLLAKIAQDDTTAIIFYCKTKLRHKGYSERVELAGINGAPIQTQTNINFITNEADVDAVMRLKIQAVKEHKELQHVQTES